MLKSDWARIDLDWRGCKRAILAFHVGDWREGESPLDALARALGVGSEDIPLQGIDLTTEREELDELAACLGAGWTELPELTVGDGVVRAISLINEKLEDVPPEILAFFGAPRKLDPFLPRPLFSGALLPRPERLRY